MTTRRVIDHGAGFWPLGRVMATLFHDAHQGVRSMFHSISAPADWFVVATVKTSTFNNDNSFLSGILVLSAVLEWRAVFSSGSAVNEIAQSERGLILLFACLYHPVRESDRKEWKKNESWNELRVSAAVCSLRVLQNAYLSAFLHSGPAAIQYLLVGRPVVWRDQQYLTALQPGRPVV